MTSGSPYTTPPLLAKTTRFTPPSPAPSSRFDEPDHVDAGVERRLIHRHPDVDLGRMVVERVELARGEQLPRFG